MPDALTRRKGGALSRGPTRWRLLRVAIALLVVAAVGGAGVGMAAPGDGSGSLLGFGINTYGQLGNATNNITGNPNPTPTAITLPGQIGPVTQVATGGGHSFVVTSSGQLYAFGLNNYGQLGNATNNVTGTPNPTPTLVTLPGQNGAITQIAAGSDHSLVATSSGQLYAFGLNYYGQLGNATGTTTTNPNPTPTPVGLPGQVGPVTQVAAGTYHSLVVTSSGQLYAFGHNRYGQLGNATNNTTDTPTATPTPVTLPGQLGPVMQIASGPFHSLAVTSSGQLYTFGLNQYGELGRATNNATVTANPTPTLVTLAGASGSVTQIAGGAEHSLAVTSSGQLYAFGLNLYGELGSTTNNTTGTPNPTPTLVAFAAGTTIDTVSKGSQSLYSLALVGNLAIATTALPSGQVGTPYQATVQAAGGTAPMHWSAQGLPAGLAIDPASGALSGTPTAAGSSSLTFTLTDSYGLTTSQTHTLNVAAAAAPPPTVANAPKLTALKQSASKWLLGSKLAQLTPTIKPSVKRAGIPVGTTYSFTLDQAARATLTFRHTAIGRRVAGKCVARTPGNTKKPRCTRTITDGTLRIQARTGTNNLRFEGRISRLVKLKPRNYTVAITATNPAGKKSAAKTLPFAIVAP